MSAFLLLGISLLAGWLLPRLIALPGGVPAALNIWLLNVALPALVLLQIPRLHPTPALLLFALGPWLVFAGAWALAVWVGRLRGWSRGTVGCLVLTAGLGNTAFIGIPLIEALRGHGALGPAVITDQLGTFLMLSTGGIAAAAYFSGGSVAPRDMLQRILFFPSFIALIAGFVVGALGGWPALVEPVLQRLADTLAPIALFAVGLQFQLRGFAEDIEALGAGLLWKLALAPAAVLGLGFALGTQGTAWSSAVLQTAMAPMISAGLLAEHHGLNPPLARRMVAIGTLLAFASVPLWSALLP